jgi:hypothetical protein
LISSFGKDGDNNKEVDEVMAQTLGRLKDAGIATIALEHLPKSATEQSDGFPIGAQAKKARADVIYLLRARTDSDVVDLFVTKDRNYSIYERCAIPGQTKRYGTVELRKEANLMHVVISPERVAVFQGEEIEPFDATKIKEIYSCIEANPGISKSKIDKEISGSHSKKADYVDFLLRVNCVRLEVDKNAHRLFPSKPFSPEYRPRGYQDPRF